MINKEVKKYKSYLSLTIISFIFALFVDSTFISCLDGKIWGLERLFYIVVSNFAFLFFFVLTLLYKKKSKISYNTNIWFLVKENLPLVFGIVGVIIAAICNYRLCQMYDGDLYYGAFITAIKSYRMTAKSAIGAFNLWGHLFIGSAILVAPFEYFSVGDMIGSYIANTTLLVITLIVLYKYIGEVMPKSSKYFKTFMVLAFAFMPYSLTLVTYFSPDYYLEIYFVWLLYAYKKDNNIMVSFIGFLLCFTKATGGLIYGLFLLFAFVIETLYKFFKTKYQFWKIKNIPITKFVLWIFPVAVYAVAFKLKDTLKLQEFSGAGTVSFGFEPYGVELQHLQSFVFGFRWIIIATMVIAILVKLFSVVKKTNNKVDISSKDLIIIVSSFISVYGMTAFLSLMTISHCPRYTCPNNVALILIFAISLNVIFRNRNELKSIIVFSYAVLVMIQTYYTFDPAITKMCNYMDTGNNKLYNIGCLRDHYEEFSCNNIGDYYVYNEEYSLYSKLIKDLLVHYEQKEDTTVFVYHNGNYEMHFSSVQYPCFWDYNKNRQTYRENDNTIFIDVGLITDDVDISQFAGRLIIISLARYDGAEMLNRFTKAGFTVKDSYVASSSYGYMTTYLVEK